MQHSKTSTWFCLKNGISRHLCLYFQFQVVLQSDCASIPVSDGTSGRLCLFFLFQVAIQGVCDSTSCFRWPFTAPVPLLPVSDGASGRLCFFFLFQMVLQCLYFLFKVAFHSVCSSTSCFRWCFMASVPLLPVSGGTSGRLCLYFLFQMALHGICASTSCFRWRLRASVPLLPASDGASGRLCLYFLFQVAPQGICASTSCFGWRFTAFVLLLHVSTMLEMSSHEAFCIVWVTNWKIFLLAIHMDFTFTKHNSEISINLFIICLTVKIAVKDTPSPHACISLTEKTDFQNMEF